MAQTVTSNGIFDSEQWLLYWPSFAMKLLLLCAAVQLHASCAMDPPCPAGPLGISQEQLGRDVSFGGMKPKLPLENLIPEALGRV